MIFMRMNYLEKLTLCILTPLVVLVACSDVSKINYNRIQGEWELINATRNGIETKTFQKATFTFSEDSIMTSNISALNNMGKISMDGHKLMTEGNKMQHSTIYLIDSTGNMILTTDIMNYEFIFTLKKK